jgi:predicted PurR-regulated permease PerM
MNRWNEITRHWNMTRKALLRWLRAQFQDAVLVGCLWLIGLLFLDVPLAPLWAFLGALFQLVPQLGTALSLVGPAFSAAIADGWEGLIYVFILYAVIVVIDGFVLQPVLMKRTAKVPVWASLLAPLLLGLLFNVWGFLLAPPLLAVVYAYRERRRADMEKRRNRS